MKRRIANIALVATLLWPAGLSNAQQTPAAEDPVLQRLDSIVERLTAIENRLAKLERLQRQADHWWADEHGIMRSANGRPIGYWGIDIVPREVERR